MADFVVQHCGPELAVVDVAPWTLFFDGSSCGVGSGLGIVLVSPRGITFEFSFPIEASATNNQAEYRASQGHPIAQENQSRCSKNIRGFHAGD